MGFILAVHVIVCVLLVICILLQAGKGGGLAESFSAAESMFGTQTNQFMVRLTTILVVIFLGTSLTLAFNSSKQDKSLMATHALPPVKAMPKDEASDPVIKIEPMKPMADEKAAGVKDAVKATIDTNVTEHVSPVTANQAK